MTKKMERLAVFVFGVVFVVVMLVLAVAIPSPTATQYDTFKIVLALAAAGVAAFIPGFLDVTVPGWIRAGGALAVFVLVFTKSPANLVVTGPLAISMGSATSNSGAVVLDLGRVIAGQEVAAVLLVHNLSPVARHVDVQAAPAELSAVWASGDTSMAIPAMEHRDLRVRSQAAGSLKGTVVLRQSDNTLRDITVESEVVPPITLQKQSSGPRASGNGGDFSESYPLCLGAAPKQYTLVPESVRFWLTGDRTACGSWSHCDQVSANDSAVCYSFSLQGHSEDRSSRNSEGHLSADYRLKLPQPVLR
jgi:hypothetical protein